MKREYSSKSAELDADHGDVNPSFGAGLGGFVIAHQPPLVHQPAEGALDDPAAGQDFETAGVVGAFDHCDRQLGAEPLDPLGEGRAGVAAVHPQNAEPGEPAQHAAQQQLGTRAFSGAGRGHDHAEHQPQSIHQQMAFAPFDAFAGIVTHRATVTGGLHALTVENGRRGATALALTAPHQHTQGVVEHGPLMVVNPLPEDMVNGLPAGKVSGQIAPWTATLGQIENGFNDPAAVFGWASAFGGFGEQRLEVSPLGGGEVGIVSSDFHRLTGATAKINSKNTHSNQALYTLFFHRAAAKPIRPLFQTGSND